MEQHPTDCQEIVSADSFGASITSALKQLLVICRRRKSLLVVGLVLVYALGTLYYFSREFIYQARASVLVHRTGDTLSGRTGDVVEGRQNYLPTHVKLITSSVVLDRALAKLKEANEDEAWPPRDALAAGLKVSAQKDTEIIEIAYHTADRVTAAAVVEAVVASYLDFVNETHRSTSKDILQILTQQKIDLDRQLHVKEKQLLDFQKSVGLLSMRDEKNNVLISRVMALDQALTQARVRRLELEVRYRALIMSLARGESIEVCLINHLDKLGREKVVNNLTSPQVNESNRRDLMHDQLELQRLQTIYGPKHPKVLLLEKRIHLTNLSLHSDPQDPSQKAQIEHDLQELAVHVLDNDLKEAKNLENELQQQFEIEKAKAIEFNTRNAPFLALETELSRLRSFYETINQRIRQVDLGGDYDVITTQVIEPPQEPTVPVSPNLKSIALNCTVLGLVLGLALCYLFEWWDTGYRGPEDIAQHLALPVFGHVPWLPQQGERRPFERIMQHSAQSVEAESFRTLRTVMMLSDKPAKKFTITSPEPGDGKTSILTNLAIAFAQSGLRTLVIDADMRRPRLRQIFDLRRSSGLSQLLQYNGLTEEEFFAAVQATATDKLDVLPSGPNPPNPTELLAGKQLSQILAWAETRYDRIVCDAPPILAVSDCAILGRMLDGALLVIRADKCDRIMAARARDSLRGMNCPVLGVIVNGVNPNDAYGYAYYRKVGYYSGYHNDSREDAEDESAEPRSSRLRSKMSSRERFRS